jgi:hypothetical protein
MYNDRIAAALIEARHRDLRERIARPRAERPARPRRSSQLPRFIVTFRALLNGISYRVGRL